MGRKVISMSEEQAKYNTKPTSEGIIIRPGVSGVGKVNEDLPMTNPISPEQREEIQNSLKHYPMDTLPIYEGSNEHKAFHLIEENKIKWLSLLLSSEQAWGEEALKWKRALESHGPEGHNYTNAEYVRLLQERKEFKDQLNQAVGVLSFISDRVVFPLIDGDKYAFEIAMRDIQKRTDAFLSSLSKEV